MGNSRGVCVAAHVRVGSQLPYKLYTSRKPTEDVGDAVVEGECRTEGDPDTESARPAAPGLGVAPPPIMEGDTDTVLDKLRENVTDVV